MADEHVHREYVREPASDKNGGSMGVIMGIILVLLLALLFFVFFGRGFFGAQQDTTPDVQVPDEIDVNIDTPQNGQ